MKDQVDSGRSSPSKQGVGGGSRVGEQARTSHRLKCDQQDGMWLLELLMAFLKV